MLRFAGYNLRRFVISPERLIGSNIVSPSLGTIRAETTEAAADLPNNRFVVTTLSSEHPLKGSRVSTTKQLETKFVVLTETGPGHYSSFIGKQQEALTNTSSSKAYQFRYNESTDASIKFEAKRNLKRRIQTTIKYNSTTEYYDGVISAFHESLTQKIELDSQDYNLVLSACTKVKTSESVRETAEAAYSFFLRSKIIPLEVFEKVMTLAELLNDHIMAFDIYKVFNKTYKTFKDKQRLLYPCLHLLAKHVISNGMSHNRGDRLMNIGLLFADLRVLVANGMPPPSEELFTDLAVAFSMLNSTDNVLNTLMEMTEAKIEPSLTFCNVLLNNALWNSDTKVIKVLLNWYLNNFECSMDLGQIDRLMHIASYKGDQTIPRLAFKMMARAGQSAQTVHYVCWARACLINYDINGAIEALLEAQVQGVNMLESPYGPSLQNLLANTFRTSTTVLDGIYFALVDLRRNKYILPPIVLNALIIAAGKINQLDRSFGTFQEYNSLFGIKPDLHAHNALLQAISASKYPQIDMMMVIFEDIETAGLQPNSSSFSILLSAMAETGEMSAIDDVFSYMTRLNVDPSLVALRRVIIRLAKDAQYERLKQATSIYNKISGDTNLPAFLKRRIDNMDKVRVESADNFVSGEIQDD